MALSHYLSHYCMYVTVGPWTLQMITILLSLIFIMTDINECNTNNGGCNQTCVNEVGTYHCECKVGFLLDDDAHGCSGILTNHIVVFRTLIQNLLL